VDNVDKSCGCLCDTIYNVGKNVDRFKKDSGSCQNTIMSKNEKDGPLKKEEYLLG
jgi:hypothetical protein